MQEVNTTYYYLQTGFYKLEIQEPHPNQQDEQLNLDEPVGLKSVGASKCKFTKEWWLRNKLYVWFSFIQRTA